MIKYMKFMPVLLLGMLCFCFGACSGDGDDEGGGAPETLKVGTKISWSGSYTIGSRGPYSEGNQSITILEDGKCSSSWSGTPGTYSYSKTGPDEATLRFSVSQYVVGSSNYFSYNVKLKFTGGNKFEMTGSKYVYKSVANVSSNCALTCTGTIGK